MYDSTGLPNSLNNYKKVSFQHMTYDRSISSDNTLEGQMRKIMIWTRMQ